MALLKSLTPACRRSLNNAARHAFDVAGGEVRVEILRSPGWVECQVSDNGARQFQVQREGGLGIVRELAASMGGQFERRVGDAGTISAVVFPSRE